MSQLLLKFGATACFVLHVHAIGLDRSIGQPGDPVFANAVKNCNATLRSNYRFGACSRLIDYVFDNTSEAAKAGLASGTSIAALLPTVLALTGSAPLELVQLTILSPWRGIATCAFSIGLPTGPFRQLRPVNRELLDSDPLHPLTREWTLMLPSISEKHWKNALTKGVIDIIIIGLAVLMLWRNKLIANWTMVPWRCEMPYLLFVWPFACITWVGFAYILLVLFSESIEIYNARHPDRTYKFWELILLAYRPRHFIHPGDGESSQTTAAAQQATTYNSNDKYLAMSTTQIGVALSQVSTTTSVGPMTARPSMLRRISSRSFNANRIKVKIPMRSEDGLCSWRWYEAIIESCAFGTYLFATSIMASLVFLTASDALVHMTLTTVCLSVVGILGTLF